MVDLASSLGGVHSLANKPTAISHSTLSEEEKAKTGVTDNLVRFSVGIENVDDIIRDLEQALEKIRN